jgi:Tfp pilus assembly protein PilF
VVADAGCKVDRLVEDLWAALAPPADHRKTVGGRQARVLTLEREDAVSGPLTHPPKGGAESEHPSPRVGRMRWPGHALRAAVGLPAILAVALSCGGSGPSAQASDPASNALARGIAAQNANKLDEATKDYFEALSNDPKNKFAYYNLGQIAKNQNRLQIAEGYYRSALEIDPNYGPALFGLGFVRQAFNSIQEAVDLYTKDIAIEPTNAAAHYNLGILLRIQGKTAQGDAEIARAIQLDPKLPQPPAPTPTPKPASPTPTR